ncbi:MAG: nucleotidyltransferase domain-containing protein [Ramlibacter sp.]|uniref:nucleotidyltransferase family protein n=1 Tax=Ramlibacter sp. TaxID=1917967 RepID=UPI00260E2368|nr:nucleotidyltransferase domain-containing protein [Ramlibacter sp.]MDH4377542.1 nucleotidyltransferase domain-containing protein [Ramlibacter sp.]
MVRDGVPIGVAEVSHSNRLQAPARYTLLGIHPAIAQHLPALASICERYKVRRLEVFGSAARATDFRADSDADFLIEFAPEAAADLHRFFGSRKRLKNFSAAASIWLRRVRFATRTCWPRSIATASASFDRLIGIAGQIRLFSRYLGVG